MKCHITKMKPVYNILVDIGTKTLLREEENGLQPQVYGSMCCSLLRVSQFSKDKGNATSGL